MLKELTAEQKLQIASLMKDKEQRQALAEMIVEYVDPGHITTNFVSMLLGTRSLNPGDLLIKKVRKGLKVYTHVPGTKPLKGEITVSERVNYILDNAIIGVTANEQDLQSGEIGTMDSIRNEMQKKIFDYYMTKIFTAMTSIWTEANTPTQYTDVGGVVTKAALDDMLQVLSDYTRPKAIVGVRNALLPIRDFAGWSTYSSTDVLVQSVGEEIARTGWIGQYMGVPLVVVNKDYNNPEDYTLLVPNDKVLVVGDNVGEFITYGGVNSQEDTDKSIVPPQWSMWLYQQFGFIFDSVRNMGVLKVTAA